MVGQSGQSDLRKRSPELSLDILVETPKIYTTLLPQLRHLPKLDLRAQKIVILTCPGPREPSKKLSFYLCSNPHIAGSNEPSTSRSCLGNMHLARGGLESTAWGPRRPRRQYSAAAEVTTETMKMIGRRFREATITRTSIFLWSWTSQ